MVLPNMAVSWLFVFVAIAFINATSSWLRGLNDYDLCTEPCIIGDESIMRPKKHGTSETSVQRNLRWHCHYPLADRICNFNRHYSERSGYWIESTTFIQEMNQLSTNISADNPIIFYDSNTGKEVFRAPVGRSWDDFIQESTNHGWPSFRDNEVNWDVVRVLSNGETVSIDGTHLGHNIPDEIGRRYCINLVSIAGNPIDLDNSTTTTATTSMIVTENLL